MQPHDPYKTPDATLEARQQEFDLILNKPRHVSIRRGFQWYVEGFQIFSRRPGAWILCMLIFLVLTVIVSIIPMPNDNFQLANLVDTFLMAGLMLGLYAQDKGRNFSVGSIFSALGDTQKVKLLVISILSFLIYGSISYIMLNESMQQLEANMASINEWEGEPGEQLQEIIRFQGVFYLALLKTTLLSVPAMMIFWFATPLIVLHRVNVITALKLSFLGCLYNIPALILFLILAIVFSIFATLPIGLGWFVLMPIFIASIYIGWKDIFCS